MMVYGYGRGSLSKAAERFRRYGAGKYGFRRGALSKAIADIIGWELGVEKILSSDIM